MKVDFIECKDGVRRAPYTLAREVLADLLMPILATDETDGAFEQLLDSIVEGSVEPGLMGEVQAYRQVLAKHAIKKLATLGIK